MKKAYVVLVAVALTAGCTSETPAGSSASGLSFCDDGTVTGSECDGAIERCEAGIDGEIVVCECDAVDGRPLWSCRPYIEPPAEDCEAERAGYLEMCRGLLHDCAAGECDGEPGGPGEPGYEAYIECVESAPTCEDRCEHDYEAREETCLTSFDDCTTACDDTHWCREELFGCLDEIACDSGPGTCDARDEYITGCDRRLEECWGGDGMDPAGVDPDRCEAEHASCVAEAPRCDDDTTCEERRDREIMACYDFGCEDPDDPACGCDDGTGEMCGYSVDACIDAVAGCGEPPVSCEEERERAIAECVGMCDEAGGPECEGREEACRDAFPGCADDCAHRADLHDMNCSERYAECSAGGEDAMCEAEYEHCASERPICD